MSLDFTSHGRWSVIHLRLQFFSQVEWITMQGHCEAIIFIFFFFLIFIWLHWVLVVACRIFDLCCVLQEQGSNPGPLYWDCGVLATGPPSKSPSLSTLHTSSTDCSGWNSGPVYPGTSTFPCRQWTTLAEPVSLSILEKMPSDDFKCSEKPNSPGEFQGKP